MQEKSPASILERAAGEHGLTHVRISDLLFFLQPACFHHRTITLVVRAFSRFVVSEVFDERRTQRLKRLASGLQIFCLGQSLRLLGDFGRKHFHLVAFHSFRDSHSRVHRHP